MENSERKSPVVFGSEPTQTIRREGWTVALSYGGSEGPFLIDMTHRSKWDLQDSNLARFKPFGVTIPESPGHCRLERGFLISRMNRTQCAIWHLRGEETAPPEGKAYTEIADGQALLAVVGQGALDVMERVTRLDLAAPKVQPPYLLQGPILHIPCQVVVLSRSNKDATILFSFSRGYAQAMADALLDSASDLGLKPGGESDLGI